MEPLLIVAFISVVTASIFPEVSGWPQSIPPCGQAGCLTAGLSQGSGT